MPLVSVVLPAHNCEQFITESIESVLNQSLTDFELIIVNDASTDRTPEIIRSIPDKRIVYLENKSKQGIARSLNKGLHFSKGRYIARMDGDDIAMDTRFEKQVTYLDENTDVSVLGTNMELMGTGTVGTMAVGDEIHRIYLLKVNTIAHPTVMMRKAHLTANRLFYDRLADYAEDYKLWTDVAGSNLKIETYPEVLLKYRPHQKQTSVTKSREMELTVHKIRLLYAYNYFSGTLRGREDIYLELMSNCMDPGKTDDYHQLIHDIKAENSRKHYFNEKLFERFFEKVLEGSI
ncbi:glycosyltransferase family 2 protein [Chitinophaga lutea]|uniref:Glycosyltransferase family 2 protein n=1 Tax=Chitinophaga lutea TaxID=2488634 RepID=A0A3N4PKT6_9BACT|nr:glycosyltransferase family 2 protein [Chitinophaga lutea]RPE08158.1 glycosyltransferase family 2 protein [Chitinophaga lutea]